MKLLRPDGTESLFYCTVGVRLRLLRGKPGDYIAVPLTEPLSSTAISTELSVAEQETTLVVFILLLDRDGRLVAKFSRPVDMLNYAKWAAS